MIRLLEGDCRARMLELPDASIDACVTDPPYELGFMGKKWDSTGIAYAPAVWAEVFRVLKPGAHVLAFGGTRTYHRMACAIEDAGFEIRDMAAWLYGSGFPKSFNISKAIDKAGPATEVQFAEFAAHYEARRISLGVTHAQICEAGGWYGSVNHGGASVNWARGYGLPTVAQWDVLRGLLGLDSCWAELIARVEHERAVIAERAGYEVRIAPGEVLPLEPATIKTTLPGSEAAAQWDGWGTALKPALEPICIARKPFSGTVAGNVLKHGTGALNIDGCRIEAEERPQIDMDRRPMGSNVYSGAADGSTIGSKANGTTSLGRWPANVMHDGSEEVVSAFPSDAGGGHWPGARGRGNISTDGHAGQDELQERFGDSGSAARFFYSAKASRADRNVGHDGGDSNAHPTVKPTDLMRWLVRLVTPPGGTVLDPFAGSGSTGRACDIEQFNAALIEIDPAYCEIIRRRIAGDLPLFAAGAVQS